MPHLSSATTMTNATTLFKLSSPIQDNDLTPIELAPILNTCNSLDNRPPSPDSPKTKKLYYASPSSSSSCSLSDPPSFLEPTPQIEIYQHQFPLDFFKVIPPINYNVNMSPVQKKRKLPVDQSIFLTKNAHIKRPRNAWIHFRCQYGQVLKSQDPTLRAEEISKRASEHWSKLSETEKKPWHGLAEQEKLAHREAFPEYRYCPRRTQRGL